MSRTGHEKNNSFRNYNWRHDVFPRFIVRLINFMAEVRLYSMPPWKLINIFIIAETQTRNYSNYSNPHDRLNFRIIY